MYRLGHNRLVRRDYLVADQAAVIAEGRSAYLRVWPDDDEAAATADVTSLGGRCTRWPTPMAGTSSRRSPDLADGRLGPGFRADDLLSQDVGEWPDDVFFMEGDPLYRQDDVFH